MPTNLPDPAQMDLNTPTGKLVGGTVGVGFLIWAFFRVKQMWRDDQSTGRQDQREDAYLTKLEARIKELEARADKFAEERNIALTEAATLRGKIEALQSKIEHIESEKQAARNLLQDIEKRHNELLAANSRLQNELDGLTRRKARPEMALPLGIISDRRHEDGK